MDKKHTSRTFEEELKLLESRVDEMGRVCGEQLARSIQALMDRDVELAAGIKHRDKVINAMQTVIDDQTLRILALRNPVAQDLRVIIAALRMANDFERIADYAANIARYVPDINHKSYDGTVESLVKMANTALAMLNEILESYRSRDAAKAIEVWHRDSSIDEIYGEVLVGIRDLMAESPENVEPCTALLFVARCCERIGDHIVNVARDVHFIINGKMYRGGMEA